MVTKEVIANKILMYLQHRLSLEQLVAWAEDILTLSQYEDDDEHTERNVLARLGLADVKDFGLDWEQCENFMNDLGYTLQVHAMETTA
jgi:ABC-type transport system involved in cytochrome c biogenesis ATPase subunit